MAKVAELHKVQLGYLRKLEGINSELELLASDIKAQKELQTRQIKLGVAALQQAVLERGKLLAKQTSALYDEQVTQVLAFRSGVSQAIQAVLSRITSLKDMKQLEGEELDQQLQDYVLNTPCQAPCAVKLPAPIALTRLDQDPILRAINEIELVPVDAKDDQKKDQQLFSFPEVQIKEGTELDVVCTDLWWASRPCFSLLPAISALPAALDSLSISTRRMYIEDQDWCCFDGGIREENGHGEKTGVNAPKVGSNVLVRLPSNKQWCRANVISNNASKSTCEVYLLDWGQTVPDVPWLDLLPTRQPFTQTPPAALECVFDEAIEAKDTLDARWTFNDLVQKFSSACKPLRVKFISQVEVSGRLVWLVELRGTKPDGTDVDIHKVISEKLAAAAEKNALSIQCRDIREEFAHTRVTFNAGRRGVQPDDTSPASEAVSPQSASNMPHTTAPITEHSAENVLSDNRGMQMTEKQEVGKQELPAGARHVTADRSSIFINKKVSTATGATRLFSSQQLPSQHPPSVSGPIIRPTAVQDAAMEQNLQSVLQQPGGNYSIDSAVIRNVNQTKQTNNKFAPVQSATTHCSQTGYTAPGLLHSDQPISRQSPSTFVTPGGPPLVKGINLTAYQTSNVQTVYPKPPPSIHKTTNQDFNRPSVGIDLTTNYSGYQTANLPVDYSQPPPSLNNHTTTKQDGMARPKVFDVTDSYPTYQTGNLPVGYSRPPPNLSTHHTTKQAGPPPSKRIDLTAASNTSQSANLQTNFSQLPPCLNIHKSTNQETPHAITLALKQAALRQQSKSLGQTSKQHIQSLTGEHSSVQQGANSAMQWIPSTVNKGTNQLANQNNIRPEDQGFKMFSPFKPPH